MSRGDDQKRKSLRWRLFRRDGWLDGCYWHATCAFGCGTIIDYGTATIDRYPLPGRLGGTYHIDNTRLACAPCNNIDGAKQSSLKSLQDDLDEEQRKVWNRALRRGTKPRLTLEEVFGDQL